MFNWWSKIAFWRAAISYSYQFNALISTCCESHYWFDINWYAEIILKLRAKWPWKCILYRPPQNKQTNKKKTSYWSCVSPARSDSTESAYVYIFIWSQCIPHTLASHVATTNGLVDYQPVSSFLDLLIRCYFLHICFKIGNHSCYHSWNCQKCGHDSSATL